MSKFTTTLYDILKDVNSGKTGLTIDEKIKNLSDEIFDFSYAVIDDETKSRIQIKILKHYLMREIAFETVGLFKLKLNERLNLIMEKYNLMYKKQDDTLSPYINNYLKETTSNELTNSDTSKVSSTTNNSDDVFRTQSDTPQGILTELKEGKYSSFAEASTDTSNSTNSQDSNSSGIQTGNGTREVSSLNGLTYQEAFRNYIDNIVSIDEQLVYEFSDLFLILYD